MALCDPLVPALLADLLAGGLAQLLVVGLALAERLVGDLEVGHELALVEEAGAERRCPRVTASSSPLPETTAAPWMSASLATLVGSRTPSVSSDGQVERRTTARPGRGRRRCPGRAWCEKWGADRTRPSRTMPGNPTDARSAAGSGATSRVSMD